MYTSISLVNLPKHHFLVIPSVLCLQQFTSSNFLLTLTTVSRRLCITILLFIEEYFRYMGLSISAFYMELINHPKLFLWYQPPIIIMRKFLRMCASVCWQTCYVLLWTWKTRLPILFPSQLVKITKSGTTQSKIVTGAKGVEPQSKP